MRKMLFSIAAVFLFGFAVKAQDPGHMESQDISKNEVPGQVMETFNEQFASAKGVDWEKKGDMYSADFEENKKDKEVYFDNSGKISKIKTEIDEAQLPSGVRNALSGQYSGYKADDFAKVEKEGETMYKVEAKKDGQESHLIFDESGKLIKEKKKDMKKSDKKM